MSLRPLALLIVLICSSTSATSQQVISLSVKNTSRVLPTSGRIQAAASIGDLTLAVWGTVALTPDNGSAVVLRSRLLRGVEPIASPPSVHGESARPSGAVAVVPLRDRFLVLWNDVRADRPGIYMRSVDTAGHPLGAEELLSPQNADSTGLRVFGRSGMRHTLLWSTLQGSAPGTYMREIGVDGTPIGEDQHIGQAITLEKRYSFFSDVAFVGVDTQQVFAVIDGRVDERRMPRVLFDGPVFIGADTSLAAVVKDTFAFFFKAFDTSMYRRVVLDTMPGLIRESIIITADSVGTPILYFTTLNDGPDHGTLITYAQAVSGTAGYPTMVDARNMSKSSTWDFYAGYQYGGIVQKRGCDNASCNDIKLYITRTNNFGNKEGYWDDYRYTIDSRGEYHRDDTLVPGLCLPRDLPAVYRTASDGLSQIRMVRNDTAILLTDTISPYQLSEPRRLAGLIERDNTIYVAWKETTGLRRSAVARWSPGTDSVLTLRSIVQLPHVGRGGYANVDGDMAYLDEEVFHTTSSGAAMAVNGSRVDYYDSGHDPSSRGQDILNTAVLFYTATSGGWRGGEVLSKWEYPSQFRPDARYITSSTSPDKGESVVAVTATWLPHLMFYGVGSGGGVTWSMEYEGASNRYQLDPFLPVEPSGVLVCGHSAARLMVGGKTTATIQYPSVDGASYQRLFGAYFLRSYFTSDGMLRLERYGLDGREAGSNSIELRARVPMPFIVQSRRDSSFALLYHGNDGDIRAAILDDSLRLVVDTAVVSPSGSLLGGPVGIIRNDSLFVAWSDAHSGVADLYGTIIRLPGRRGTASVAASPDIPSDVSMMPLPANESVTVVTPSSLGNASLEIHDAFGRVVREKEEVMAGASHGIDVSALPNGVYLVVIEAGTRSVTRKLVVLH